MKEASIQKQTEASGELNEKDQLIEEMKLKIIELEEHNTVLQQRNQEMESQVMKKANQLTEL